MATHQQTREKPPQIALSVEEAARSLGLGRRKLEEYLFNGSLPSRKVGTRRLILVSDLQAFAEQLPRA